MNFDEERGDIEQVMLSEAKHLRRWHANRSRRRPFASLRVTWGVIPRSFLNVHDRVPTKLGHLSSPVTAIAEVGRCQVRWPYSGRCW